MLQTACEDVVVMLAHPNLNVEVDCVFCSYDKGPRQVADARAGTWASFYLNLFTCMRTRGIVGLAYSYGSTAQQLFVNSWSQERVVEVLHF